MKFGLGSFVESFPADRPSPLKPTTRWRGGGDRLLDLGRGDETSDSFAAEMWKWTS
jgi:hypothetical protein